LLVAESNCLRRHMSAETANLREAAAWFERGVALTRSLRTAWPLLAPAAGFFIARKRFSWVRLAGRGWTLWKAGKKLAAFWKRHASRSASQ
jgi:hypothetical protein